MKNKIPVCFHRCQLLSNILLSFSKLSIEFTQVYVQHRFFIRITHQEFIIHCLSGLPGNIRRHPQVHIVLTVVMMPVLIVVTIFIVFQQKRFNRLKFADNDLFLLRNS